MLITNVKPIWSSSEIKQLLSTSGSEVKVLKKREGGSVISDEAEKIKCKIKGNMKKGIGMERGMSGNGDTASVISVSTGTASNNTLCSTVPEGSSFTTNGNKSAQIEVNSVSERSSFDGIECVGPAKSNLCTDVSNILGARNAFERSTTLADTSRSNTSAVLLSQSDNFSCTPFRYYDSNTPLKSPIKVKHIGSYTDITASRTSIIESVIEVVEARAVSLLNGDDSCFLNTNVNVNSIGGGDNQVIESEMASVKREENIGITTFSPEQPINLRACINSLPDATPKPFNSQTKTAQKNSYLDSSIKHVKGDGNVYVNELHGKEEASLLCTIIGWKDDVSGLHSAICDRPRDTEIVSEAGVMDRTDIRRSGNFSRPKGRTSLSMKENVLDKFNISSISNVEIHCLNERSGMGVILDYRVHTVLLSSLRNTWLVPGKRIQIILAVLSQIDVGNDLIRLTRSDHTVVSSLDDMYGELTGERRREENEKEREKERGCRQLYKWSLGRCDSASVEVNNTSHCERESALESERRRYEALCLNKVHYESPLNLSYEGCARHRVNCVTVALHTVMPAAAKHDASNTSTHGRDSQPLCFTDDSQLQSFSGIIGKNYESQGRNKENHNENCHGQGDQNSRYEKRWKGDEATAIQKKQKSPLKTVKLEKKCVQRVDADGNVDLIDENKGNHSAPSENVLISVVKGKSTVIMEIRCNLLPPQLRAICSPFGKSGNPSNELKGERETRAARSGEATFFDLVYTEVWRSDHFIPNFKHPNSVPLGNPRSRRNLGTTCITSPHSILGTGNVQGVRMGLGMERRPKWRVVWMEERNTNSVSIV